MLNVNGKGDDLRDMAKGLLDILPKKRLREVVDFIEFLREKEEVEKPLSKIVEGMHRKTIEKGMKNMTEEDIAEIIHQKRGVK